MDAQSRRFGPRKFGVGKRVHDIANGKSRDQPLPRLHARDNPEAADAASRDVGVNAIHSLGKCRWVPETPDTSHPPVSLRSTLWTETSLPSDHCFFELTTIPPEFSSFRIVAPHKVRQSRFKGKATARRPARSNQSVTSDEACHSDVVRGTSVPFLLSSRKVLRLCMAGRVASRCKNAS